MLNKLISFLKKNNAYSLAQPCAVAVSGGLDSVVLAALCKQAKIRFCIVHCNFQLRGEESKRDENFVIELGRKYEVQVLVQRFNTETYAANNNLSIQEAARNLRYQWFLELHQAEKISFTLLAHQANDNMETVVMNFFRGTGLNGLKGMSLFQPLGHCLRPLLDCTRKEIEMFAQENQLTWVEDSSNVLNKYTRNYFRNTILPQIQSVYPQVDQNILDNIDRFTKTEILYRELVQKYKAKIGHHKPSGAYYLPVKWLQSKMDSALIYEIIKDYGFGENAVNEVHKLMESDSGKYISNEQFKIIKHGKWLIIASNTSTYDPVPIDKKNRSVHFDGDSNLKLKFITAESVQLQTDPNKAQINEQHLEWPLLLRKWKQGDYFYPLGMDKKKKVARFLIDSKLSKDLKERVWVIESGKRIIWVVGMRIDDRFKITPNTKNILELTLSNP